MNDNSVNRLYESVVRIEVISILFEWSTPFFKTKSPTGSGSGFLIDNEGHILTCFHVINQAVNIFVTIPQEGKEKIPANIVSIFPEMDMAIIKIQKKGGRFLEICDSDKIKIGKEVLAIGYPLGQDKLKITKGIVSGLESGYIQTDAPINPGNSGGPLVYEGKVIGINTAKIVQVGTEGVGYANPINFFNNVKQKMIPTTPKNEAIRIEQASLGILADKCSKQIIDFYDCECSGGIQMTKVFKNSPLTVVDSNNPEDYPAKDGDILCSIDNYDIDNNGECKVEWNREKVSYKEVFDRISLTKNTIRVKYYTILENQKIQSNANSVKTYNESQNTNSFFQLDKFNLQTFLQKITGTKEPSIYYKTIGKIIEKDIPIISNTSIFKIWNYYPPYDNVDYVCFGGIVFMNLAMNHIMMKQFQHLFYNHVNKLDVNAVLISKILPSSIKIDGILDEGDIITEINNVPILTIYDVKEALKKPILKMNSENKEDCYITFKTGLNKFYAVSLKKVLKEDIQLFQYFNYEPSEATKFFVKNYKEYSCLLRINNSEENSSIKY